MSNIYSLVDDEEWEPIWGFPGYEISVSKYYNMTKSRLQCELPGITRKGDTVKGFCSESDIDNILMKMTSISGSAGLQFSQSVHNYLDGL